MSKKIVGYKLVKPEYRDAVLKIINWPYLGTDIGEREDITQPLNISKLEEAKVLDLWFEPVYEYYKVGDWVITKGYSTNYDGKALRIERISGGRYCYFSPSNGSSNFDKGHIIRLATKEEIGKSLLEEAAKRYPEGTKFKSAADGRTFCVSGGVYEMWYSGSHTDAVANSIGEGLFCTEGRWAEIITNEVPNIVINGYESEFTENSIRFGCQEISKEMIYRLAELSKYNIYMVDADGNNLSNEIEEIRYYFKSL